MEWGRRGGLCGNTLLSAAASAESFRLRTLCTVSQMPIMAAMSFYSGFPEVHFTIWQLYIGNFRMILLIEVIIFLKENLKKVIRPIHGFCSYSTYVRCIVRLCLFTVLFFFLVLLCGNLNSLMGCDKLCKGKCNSKKGKLSLGFFLI